MVTFPQVIIRLILAGILSSLIGIERELKHRGAGLRTHILVCLGSTLIMLTSLYVFDIYKNITTIDPSRIAAGIVTGIGFLCAGTIIRYGEAVKGLTTAASLWVVSAIGMAIGCGFYSAAVVVAIIVLVVLIFLRRFEKHLGKEIDENPKA
ncbi:MAG: MgtC/SapB family protein [Candidatus Omnitrophota bacterium]|nr:MgtC/SapB family protein [Candidatus Omnitrophota bacterium]